MKQQLFLTALALAICFPTFAQKSNSGKHHKVKKDELGQQPKEASATAHTTYSYYDATKGGYVMIKNGKKTFTPTSPPLPGNIDMLKSDIKLTKWLNLDLYPQLHYPNNTNIGAPVEKGVNNVIPR